MRQGAITVATRRIFHKDSTGENQVEKTTHSAEDEEEGKGF